MKKQRLTLSTICSGALQEKIDRAMEKVARNILDPNTNQTKARTITIKITFKPNDKDPEDVFVSAQVQAQMAPEIGTGTSLFVNRDLETDKITVMEHSRGEIRGQLSFGDIEEMSEEFDPETGEIYQDDKVQEFRKTM